MLMFDIIIEMFDTGYWPSSWSTLPLSKCFNSLLENWWTLIIEEECEAFFEWSSSSSPVHFVGRGWLIGKERFKKFLCINKFFSNYLTFIDFFSYISKRLPFFLFWHCHVELMIWIRVKLCHNFSINK